MNHWLCDWCGKPNVPYTLRGEQYPGLIRCGMAWLCPECVSVWLDNTLRAQSIRAQADAHRAQQGGMP